ncbi:Membrane dipeptidase (Peptidase family M19) [Cnuella takakiae]|uniref:Membrane dipeptidase (Peptidase family M19) n=1 Tax=Cnuella takakiae TaxID=1302690 RepID=A0A1M4WJJ5_9BACT|nr:membrane dipeptidase [Cnuella takakiae]OLY91703.1 hypothetical protein BUE76_07175 [Cnuella takakiae]SHE81162.1 Membrane dipeptidase (Peptidase family M19) [Cnuella takakiae]
MPSLDFSIDLHCHPQYKPMGKSYGAIQGVQSEKPNEKASMWHYNPPTDVDKLLNQLTGLTKFSQTNLTASMYGGVWVMVVSLGAIEKWFFCHLGGGDGIFKDIMADFAVGVGTKRINAIQGMKDYFADLDQEYKFIQQMQDRVVTIDGKKLTYRMVRNFEELAGVMEQNQEALTSTTEGKPITLALIPSIEGMHVLNCGLDSACDAETVKANARMLKKHPHKPWFVTFAHHFYNELCGHAPSLRGKMSKRCNQSHGMGTGFTDLGKEVLEILLDDTDGNRILIDIKHLSAKGRAELMELRRKKYKNLPLIISHGACNGLPNPSTSFSKYPELGNDMSRGDINFYDEEILEMARSGGIMGLQLDERRIASEERLKQTKSSLVLSKKMHYRSQLVWNQIQYIAELLDDNNLFAWDCIALGSDYDGIVDPVNTFWTFEEYTDLKGYVERHAFTYMKEHSSRLKNSFNKIDADIIVQRVFQENAWNFFKKWFSENERIPLIQESQDETKALVLELAG